MCLPLSWALALLWWTGSEEWRIHGLWVESCQISNGTKPSYPEYCRNVSWNLSEIASLIPFLESSWYPSTNFSLPRHEWLKHGSCAGNWTEVEYFQHTECVWKNIEIPLSCDTKRECVIPVHKF